MGIDIFLCFLYILKSMEHGMQTLDDVVRKLYTHIPSSSTPLEVIHGVARLYNVDPLEVLNSSTRKRHITLPRHIAMMVLYEKVGLSLETIRRYFVPKNGRSVPLSHTSVRLGIIHAHKVLGNSSSLKVQNDFSCVVDSLSGFLMTYNKLQIKKIVHSAVSSHDMTPPQILELFSTVYGLSLDIIKGSKRSRYLSAVRAGIANVLYEKTLSCASIGELLGNKNHASILYYLNSLKTAGLYESAQ